MLRRFRVVVNGLAYEVDVEEISTSAPAVYAPPAAAPVITAAATPAPSPAAPAVTAAPKPVPAAPTVAAAPEKPEVAVPVDGTAVMAPLPGGVLEVKVAKGSTVTEGQVLVILEAMKMENEITAPQSGTVGDVRVKPGDAVSVGDVLVVLQ